MEVLHELWGNLPISDLELFLYWGSVGASTWAVVHLLLWDWEGHEFPGNIFDVSEFCGEEGVGLKLQEVCPHTQKC